MGARAQRGEGFGRSRTSNGGSGGPGLFLGCDRSWRARRWDANSSLENDGQHLPELGERPELRALIDQLIVGAGSDDPPSLD